MIGFLFQKYKSYIICAGFLVILCTVTFGYYKIKQIGYKQCKAEYAAAEKKAQDQATKNIKKVKKDAKVIYKYIRDQDNTCDIYRNVIDRLPNPVDG